MGSSYVFRKSVKRVIIEIKTAQQDVCTTFAHGTVGTHPNHQKRGLGKAAMNEGLRRAQALGATLATVSSYATGAHALYESMGFTEFGHDPGRGIHTQ
jgi:GNAT superfamily N-acetyltransferase